MSHIDTLKVYEEYMAAGFDDKTAKKLTNVLENSFMTKVKELREDFASQKLVSILGGLILTALVTLIGITWNISIDLQVFKTCGIVAKQEVK